MRFAGSTLDRDHDVLDVPVGDVQHTPVLEHGASLPPPTGPVFTAPVPARRHPWRLVALIGALLVLVGGAVTVFVIVTHHAADVAPISVQAPATVVADQPFDVTVVVRNSGDAGGEMDLTVLRDGVVLDSRTVQADAGEEVTLTFRVNGLTSGTHEFTIEGVDGLSATVVALTPALIVIDELTASPDVVDLSQGATVTVTVRFTNTGEADGDETLVLLMDGRSMDERAISVAGGDSGTVVFSLTMDARGEHVLEVGDASVTVTALAPAELSVDAVTVSPDPLDLNASTDVTVTARLTNIGDLDGTFPLEVTLDGAVVATRDVTIPGGETASEQFAVTVAHPGMNSITVNGVEAGFDVYQLARPATGTVIVNQLGGGVNQLKIVNDSELDVYVVLAAPGENQPALLGVYVRAHESTTVRHIIDGTYVKYFVQGTDWCTFYQRFTGFARCGMFDRVTVFDPPSNQYTVLTLTFGASSGESAPTTDVDPDSFPM